MPMYEFECNECKHRFEELVLSSSKTIDECPSCHGNDVKKLVSAGSFRGAGATSTSTGASAPACSPTGG